MSMLAGPRRKQKVINLRAKNNLWSNDTNKFGQRMLEKMGWSSGKGLGAHENGIVEHVVAKYKNDDRGLGFEDRNDQWTKHEDDFNSLLANLSNSDNHIENNAPSGVSLEVKSKKSKARIHYHKYTRGKDLSRYSEKELANIFGKKTFKEETIDKPLKDDVKTSEQVFTEKGSMDDYFKNKLASLKLKSKLFNTDKHNEEITEYGFQGFASTVTPEESESNINSNNEFQPFSFYATKPNNYIKSNDNLMSEEFTNETEQVIKKKKKKKSKSKDTISTQENCTELQENNELSEQITDNVVVPAEEKKRKKKKKLDAECDAEDNNYIKKNKKSRDHTELCQDQNDCIDNSIPKKKKKRKNKNE